MPNCDFYAAGSDFKLVLDFVFSESNCRVFESYSPYGEQLAEFNSYLEIESRYNVGQCRGSVSSVLLQLLPVGAGEVIIERINLEPQKCNGFKFRYCVNGWGLIQLYLGGISPTGLVHSHTNHNSEKRALAWETTYKSTLGSVSYWSWPVIESTSRRINSFIRKVAVAKNGSRPVLPQASVVLAESKVYT